MMYGGTTSEKLLVRSTYSSQDMAAYSLTDATPYVRPVAFLHICARALMRSLFAGSGRRWPMRRARPKALRAACRARFPSATKCACDAMRADALTDVRPFSHRRSTLFIRFAAVSFSCSPFSRFGSTLL